MSVDISCLSALHSPWVRVTHSIMWKSTHNQITLPNQKKWPHNVYCTISLIWLFPLSGLFQNQCVTILISWEFLKGNNLSLAMQRFWNDLDIATKTTSSNFKGPVSQRVKVKVQIKQTVSFTRSQASVMPKYFEVFLKENNCKIFTLRFLLSRHDCSGVVSSFPPLPWFVQYPSMTHMLI